MSVRHELVERPYREALHQAPRAVRSAPEVRDHGDQRKKRRKSFLREMFEFGE